MTGKYGTIHYLHVPAEMGKCLWLWDPFQPDWDEIPADARVMEGLRAACVATR